MEGRDGGHQSGQLPIGSNRGAQEIPSPPYPIPPPEALQVRLFTSPVMADHLEVTDGEWPEVLLDAPEDDADPLPIAVGADVAKLSQLEVGDTFVLKPFSGLPNVFEVVEVAAIVAPVDAGQKIWGIDDPVRMVYLPLETFDAWTAPIGIAAVNDPWLRTDRGLTSLTATQRWILDFDPDSLEFEEVERIRGALANFRGQVSQDSGGLHRRQLVLAAAARQVRRTFGDGWGPDPGDPGAGRRWGALFPHLHGGAAPWSERGRRSLCSRPAAPAPGKPPASILRSLQSWPPLRRLLLLPTWPACSSVSPGGSRRCPTSPVGEPLQVAQVASITPYVIGGAIVTFLSMGLAILPFARRPVLELRSLSARPAGKLGVAALQPRPVRHRVFRSSSCSSLSSVASSTRPAGRCSSMRWRSSSRYCSCSPVRWCCCRLLPVGAAV